MKQIFKKNDLVVTDNFTLKQDIYRVGEDGALKLIGRYEKSEIFKALTNFIKSDKLYKKKNNVYVKQGTIIPKEFEYKKLVRQY